MLVCKVVFSKGSTDVNKRSVEFFKRILQESYTVITFDFSVADSADVYIGYPVVVMGSQPPIYGMDKIAIAVRRTIGIEMKKKHSKMNPSNMSAADIQRAEIMNGVGRKKDGTFDIQNEEDANDPDRRKEDVQARMTKQGMIRHAASASKHKPKANPLTKLSDMMAGDDDVGDRADVDMFKRQQGQKATPMPQARPSAQSVPLGSMGGGQRAAPTGARSAGEIPLPPLPAGGASSSNPSNMDMSYSSKDRMLDSIIQKARFDEDATEDAYEEGDEEALMTDFFAKEC